MIITNKAIPRRTVLRGLGASLALPLLDAMLPALAARTHAAAVPVIRFGVVYVPNGIMMPHWMPDREGEGFELKSILNKYDFVTAFSFNDDTFTMDQEYMKEFLVRYKKEIGIPYVCNTTVLDVDREMLEVMKDSNCELVRFGVETATTRIKREILKRLESLAD